MKYWILIIGLFAWNVAGSGDVSKAGSSSLKTSEGKPVKTQMVSILQLQQTLLDDVRRRINEEEIVVTLQVLFPKKPITIPAGTLELKVDKDRFGQLSGRRAFRVQLIVDSQPIQVVSVVASVTARAEVLTPIRWIKLHEVVHAKDLVKTSVNLRTFNQDVAMFAEEVVGKQATRSLPPHQPVRPSHLTVPPLVYKGDRVMIEVHQGGLFIQTPGIAKASGLSGELILVSNLSSGREVLATILNPGVVEVRF